MGDIVRIGIVTTGNTGPAHAGCADGREGTGTASLKAPTHVLREKRTLLHVCELDIQLIEV